MGFKYIFFATLYIASLSTFAQTPFATLDSIDANRINARVLVHGDMWWDPELYQPHCNFPPNSLKNVGFAGAIWLSAYDNSGQLHVSAQTYRQDGNDYWPGPLDGSGSLDYATSEKWAKIWKVRRREVEAHLTNVFRSESNTPQSILTWPAKGNSQARGKDGIPLIITEEMAPFVDINGDGIYQPLGGDYPDFPGDQALWWVFSDNGPAHSQTNARPLMAQVHAMAYAFNRNTLIDYVVYYDYTIVNKSANYYHDMRMALWDDGDLGYALDDFVKFDSGRRMGIIYNATNDDGAAAGHPANSYGLNPPAKGVTIISMPGDLVNNYRTGTSFTYYNNDMSIIGNPRVDTEYNNYMRHKMRNGSSGNWQINECTSMNNPGDRRFVLATDDFTLAAGSRAKVVMAMVVDSAAGGCPGVDFEGVGIVADTAWNLYNNVSIGDVTKSAGGMSLFPNPAHNTLHIAHVGSEEGLLTISNAVGQEMCRTFRSGLDGWVIDVSKYPPGLYVAVVKDRGVTLRTTFIIY